LQEHRPPLTPDPSPARGEGRKIFTRRLIVEPVNAIVEPVNTIVEPVNAIVETVNASTFSPLPLRERGWG
jgi:hypothetical protein